MPRGVVAQRSQEVHPSELRPVRLREPHFRIRALPQQESRQPLLPRCADHQIGVGLPGGVQVLRDALDGDGLDHLFCRGPIGQLLAQQGPHSSDDLLTAAVPDRDIDVKSAGLGGGLGPVHGLPKTTSGLLSEQFQVADGPDTPPICRRTDLFDDVGDDLDQRGKFTAIALQGDGKILVGGAFGVGTSIGGQSRFRFARLDAVTGLADSFDPNVSNGSSVNTIAVQPDGKILIGGAFTKLSPNGGAAVTRSCIARLEGLILNMQRSAANVVLSWGTNFTSYTLETSTNLSTTNWSTVSPAPVVSGSKNVVTNEFTNSTRFYRLRK